MAPSEHSGSGTATRRSKRDSCQVGSSQKVTKRARHDEAATTIPQSVFPLLWSFLLESPSNDDTINPESMTGCIDFKSIASIMVVNRGAKEAFDECNGWSLCPQAVKKDVDAKEEFIESFLNRAMDLARSGVHEDIQQCCALVEDEDCIRAVSTRLVRVKNEFLPLASRLAGKHYYNDASEDNELFGDLHHLMLNMVFQMLNSTVAIHEMNQLYAQVNEEQEL